jgi:hypothetical protein
MRRIAGILAATLIGAGCSLIPSPAPGDFDIVVDNGTTMDLVVRVNGVAIHGFGPGDGGTIPASGLGTLPWTVEAVTASGRRVTSMDVVAGSSGCSEPAGGDANRECHGVLTVADLSCGRIVMYTNATTPEIPAPMPGVGVPGDCDP